MARSAKHHPLLTELEADTRPFRGRRRLAWVLFVMTLGLGLILPFLAAQSGETLLQTLRHLPFIGAPLAEHFEATRDALATRRPDPQAGQTLPRASIPYPLPTSAPPPPTAGALDSSWNPGPLSSAHQPWAEDCQVCHAVPFTRVRDAECLACHQDLGQHVDSSKVHLAGLTDQRCATCHRDHSGEFGLRFQSAAMAEQDCSACHKDLSKRLPETRVGDVADFAHKHPEFRVQLAADPATEALTRVRQAKDVPLSEPTSLKFPHDVHLEAKGIDSPTGIKQLRCADCHVAEPDGLGFRPVTMAAHCQSCHALKIEPTMSNREVPHGDVAAALSSLREFYTYLQVQGAPPGDGGALTRTVEIKRPGAAPEPRRTRLATDIDAKARAAQAAETLFEQTACVVCHEVRRKDGPGMPGTPGEDLPQWAIAPVRESHPWLPKSVFNHEAHATSACGDCHAAGRSAKASDVLIPDIAVCRDCHAGSVPTVGKVTSGCTLCHGFHEPARLPVAANQPKSPGPAEPRP